MVVYLFKNSRDIIIVLDFFFIVLRLLIPCHLSLLFIFFHIMFS